MGAGPWLGPFFTTHICSTSCRVSDEFESRFPGKIKLVKADISDLQSVDVITAFLSGHQITLNCVVFNAGMTDRSDFLQIEPENWLKVFNANVHFPVFLMQKLYPVFAEGGCVVFTGSLMAIHPHSVSLAYGVTKASVHDGAGCQFERRIDAAYRTAEYHTIRLGNCFHHRNGYYGCLSLCRRTA